jgi:hypothetical protein
LFVSLIVVSTQFLPMFISNLPSRIRSQTRNVLKKAFSIAPEFKQTGLLLALGLCYASSHAVSLPASNLKVTVKAGTVVLTWSGTPDVLYQAESAANAAGPWQAVGEPTAAFSVTNIPGGPIAFFRVGIFTNTVQYLAAAPRSTGDKAAPTVPTGLTATASACNQVVLSWTASTDQGTKVGGTTYTSGLKGYNVYRSGVFLKQVLAPATSTTDTSVGASTSYSYTVAAIDNLGNASSQSSPRSVTTPACASCFAVIGVSSSPTGAGTVSGGTTVNCGTTVTVTASANSGYTFANWTENGNLASSSASYSFVASANRTLVANFTPVSGSGPALRARWTFDNGTVSGSTAIDSSGNGNSATLSGSPLPTIVPGKTNQAVSLDGYSGSVSAADAANLNITGPFTVATWINFNALPGFSQYPSIVAKLSSPSSCYGYGISWNGSGVVGILGSGSPSWTVTAGSPVPVVGAWNHYAVVFDGSVLKLYVNGALHTQTAASAPASSSGAPIKMGAHYSNPSVYGFVNGKLDDVRIYGQALTASDVATLYNSAASIIPSNVSITTSASPSYAGVTSGGGTIVSGTSATVTASPYVGYSFANWTENGTIVSYSSAYTFTANANRALVANFIAAPCTYSITGAVFPSGAGTASGGGIFGCGSTITMTATANIGYSFVNWTENGNVVSTLPIYVSLLNGNRSLVANFAATPASYTITTSSSPAAGGSTSGGRTATVGTTVTVTATPNAGYNFVSWTENGTVVSTSSSFGFTVNGNRNLVANFTPVTTSGPWAKRLGGTGNESGTAVTVDANGNTLVAGYFMGSVDFGGGLLTSAGGYDLYLAKYSPSGAHLWSKRFGSSGNELVSSIALDSSGNIFLAGSFYGTANFGGANLTSGGDADAFLAKYSAQGDPIWSQRFGANMPDVFNKIAVDSQGNVIATGFFQGTVLVGSTTLYSWGNGIDPMLAKFSPTGVNLWAKNFYNAGTEYGNGIAVDKRINPLTGLPYDNIVIAGYFNGYINFGGGQSDANLLTTAGGYIAKFSPAGGHLWSKPYGGSNGSTRFWGMALDSNGDVAVTGDFSQQTSLGGANITGTSWGLDLFVAKYSGADGSYRWATPILGYQATTGRPTSIAIDAQNNVLMTGYFQGNYDFSGQSITSTAGVPDGLVAKYGAAGNRLWVQGFASTSSGSANSVTVDASNHPVVTGYFTGSARCAGQTLTSAGGTDAVLMSLNP